jgi:hypothetical protein
MWIQHLRRNAVAYVALAVALSTGTAYAADKVANGSITSAKLAKASVTKPKIKKNAVTSKAIKNGAVTQTDLAPGLLENSSWSSVGTLSVEGPPLVSDPSHAPDRPNRNPFTIVVPRAGTLQVAVHFTDVSGACTSGDMFLGLYVDGRPVPDTGMRVFGSPRSFLLAGRIPVIAGNHTVTHAMDCPTGDMSSYGSIPSGWLVSLD